MSEARSSVVSCTCIGGSVASVSDECVYDHAQLRPPVCTAVDVESSVAEWEHLHFCSFQPVGLHFVIDGDDRVLCPESPAGACRRRRRSSASGCFPIGALPDHCRVCILSRRRTRLARNSILRSAKEQRLSVWLSRYTSAACARRAAAHRCLSVCSAAWRVGAARCGSDVRAELEVRGEAVRC